jgi:hypothetical protein
VRKKLRIKAHGHHATKPIKEMTGPAFFSAAPSLVVAPCLLESFRPEPISSAPEGEGAANASYK